MSKKPWYRRYGADFVHGCLGLTLEEKGAYSLCLDLIYDRRGPIPDDPRWLAGVCGVSLRKWKSLRQSLIEAGKIYEKHGHLSNLRAEREIENASKESRKHAENGAKGGQKRAQNASRSKQINALAQAGLEPRARLQNPEAKESLSIEMTPGRLRELFDPVWRSYPGKQGKMCGQPGAIIAFKRAIERGHDPDHLAMAARAYAASDPAFPIQFTKWLDTEGWQAWMPEVEAVDWGGEVDLFKRFGKWRPEGPEPGEPGCRAPQAVLEGAGFTVMATED